MTILIAVETAVLLVLTVLVVGLLRAYATVLQRLHHLDGGPAAAVAPPFRTADGVIAPGARGPGVSGPADIGPITGREEWAAAHDITGVGLSGEVISVRTVAVPHDTVLVFLSSGCAGCGGFWEDFAERGGSTPLGGSRVLVITKDAGEESVTLLSELRPAGLDLVMSSAAWADYDVPGSPYVVVVDGQTGRVKGEGSGTSLRQVSGLIHQAVGDGRRGARHHDDPVDKPRSDAEREVDVDRALLAAGIGPGHPSLYGPGPDLAAHPPETPMDQPFPETAAARREVAQ